MVELFYEETSILDLDPEFFVLWLNKVCNYHKRELGDLSLIFSSDDYLLNINREHLKHDYYTDIITFNYNEGKVVSGDLFVSVDRVRENAIEVGEEFYFELNRVVAHGVLHLLGFNDKSDKEKAIMRKMEDEALSLIVPRET